jgi:hypothetical protein
MLFSVLLTWLRVGLLASSKAFVAGPGFCGDSLGGLVDPLWWRRKDGERMRMWEDEWLAMYTPSGLDSFLSRNPQDPECMVVPVVKMMTMIER